MTESTETPDRQYTGDELRTLLTAGAKYTGSLSIQGATHLLIFTDVPDRLGFRALVEVELGLYDRIHKETYDVAIVRWAGLLDAARSWRIGGAGQRLLDLAVSMAAGRPVDLREALPGLGHAHARRVVEAVAIATEADEFYTLTPRTKLAELHALHAEMQGAPAPRSPLPPFDESRRRAYALLDDAADEVRMGDWSPAPSADQRAAVRRAVDLIGQAKAALNEAAL
ncbi:hypothetical protein AB0A95_34610 [Micromonospora sp. NPDC049230]|uniref:hypothetical protein n=1 Tax=Micromonospora sp. NPDC049230 TaxID=3155502 RepID=UPI0033FAAF28